MCACFKLLCFKAIHHPFGMIMPNRSFSSPDYRYGFQGQEVDNEIKGNNNSLNYKFRMHDPRVGRFFAVDPLQQEYPYYSPYQFSGNRVIDSRELEGKEPTPTGLAVENGTKEGATKYTHVNMWMTQVRYHGGGAYTQSGWYVAKDYDFITKLKTQNRDAATQIWAEHHISQAMKIGDGSWDDLYPITTSASVFSTNAKIGNDAGGDGSRQNAYRHGLWQAMITYEFDKSIAEGIGNAHEQHPNLYLTLQDQAVHTLRFDHLYQADEYVDLVNNHNARNLGASWTEEGLTRKEQALKVLDYFHETGFWIAGKDPNDNTKYKVWTHKLTDEEYNRAKTNIMNGNDWGFNDKDGDRKKTTDEYIKNQ